MSGRLWQARCWRRMTLLLAMLARIFMTLALQVQQVRCWSLMAFSTALLNTLEVQSFP